MPVTNKFEDPNFDPLAGLPPARFALLKVVAEAAEKLSMPLYIVGGYVRDLLLEYPHTDVDLVVEGDAIRLGEALKRAYTGKFVTHKRFGTAKWQVGANRDAIAKALADKFRGPILAEALPESLDLISARREFYAEPTALPTVKRDSIKMDLHRRDFPINTLAVRLDGEHYGKLHDYWGGLDDLRSGCIRVMHSLSFVDDPTRILRAVKYEMRYGFEIESESMALLVEAVPLLARVSGDRIRTEISLILEEDKAADMLGRLDELGVLRVLHPDLRWDKASAARLTAARGAERDAVWEMDAAIDGMTAQAALSYLTWLLAQRSTVAASVAGRLRLPAWLSKAIIAAARAYPELGSIKRMKPSAATQWLDTLPLLAVFGLWLASKDKGIQASLFNYAAHWRHVRPKADGALLGEMGIPAGPRYGQLLGQLRAAWLDGEITDAAGEGALLERLVEKAHE